MCAPECFDAVARELDRRSLLKGALAGGAAIAAVAAPKPASARQMPVIANRVVDLTHTLSPEFPTFGGGKQLEIETLKTFENDGYNTKKWTLSEHTGTHIDAPIHFSATGASADEIPADQLVAPLVVIDIRERADGDANTTLTPDDIKAWIKANGPIPPGACVAMNSGWDRHATSAKFRNADDKGVLHFPGFHSESAKMLLEEADIVGIASDTISLDQGQSKDFACHVSLLPAGKWGLENVANLSAVSQKGATIVVGVTKIKGATGGPTRVMALM
jgi:kynurenine formamidase